MNGFTKWLLGASEVFGGVGLAFLFSGIIKRAGTAIHGHNADGTPE